MADYRIVTENNSFVKYKGRPFGIKLVSDGLSYALLRAKSVDFPDTEYTFEGMKYEDGVFSVCLPDIPKGLYLMSFEAVSNSEGFETYEFNVVSVDEKYGDIVPPSGVMYHIFVDRFKRSGKSKIRNDVLYRYDWNGEISQYGEKPGDYVENNEFFGGDLYGIIEKLDYIKSLGGEWIYLSPIFTAYSNHKYDTCDFMSVDEMFGSDKALSELITSAHENGMKIILDGVFNHVGRDSVYFDYKNLCGGAYKNKDSVYREWFDIRDDGSYDCWWGITNLPKIKKVQSYRDFICKTVIPKYMKMGIDGWRLDVCDEYDNKFLEEITLSAKSCNENAIIIGEVWDDPVTKVAYDEKKTYFYGESLDSSMNYPLRRGILNYFLYGENNTLSDCLSYMISHYPIEKLNVMMNILDTHDTERAITVFGKGYERCDAPGHEAMEYLTKKEYEIGKKKLKSAYTLLALLPGIPSVFYGDEIGMQGGHDPFCRRTVKWDGIDYDILKLYRKVGEFRKLHRTVSTGDMKIIQTNDGFFVFDRTGDETVRVVSNMSGKYDYFVPEEYVPYIGSNVVSDGETAVFILKK